MKKLLLILFVLFSVLAQAQNQKKSVPNKNKVTPPVSNNASKSISNNHTQNLVNGNLQHDTCLNKKFSIVFYVILDSLGGVGPASAANIAQCLDTLNNRFKRICISFANCSTVFIPEFEYNKWNPYSTDTTVRNLYYTDKTINIYLPDSIKPQPMTEPSGYSYGPPAISNQNPARDYIVIEKWHLIAANSLIPLHHFGHFFGLNHTHAEISPTLVTVPATPVGLISKEFVDGSNCLIHGDGICDTEADPGSSGITQDGKGDFFIPPIDNYMSFSSSSNKFTQMQYNRMAYVILTQRLYLH